MSNPFATGITGKCPHCQTTSMFSHVFMMHESCPECGAVFYRDPGSWTGSTAMGYVTGSVIAVIYFTLLWATDNLYTVPGWASASIVSFGTLLCYRFSKGLWVGILHGMEQVYPDPGWVKGAVKAKPRKKRLDLNGPPA